MQAVTFLVIHQKHKKSLEEITNDLCPVLSVQQLYRIRYTSAALSLPAICGLRVAMSWLWVCLAGKSLQSEQLAICLLCLHARLNI